MKHEMELRLIFVDLQLYSDEVSPRGLKVKEIENGEYTLSPYNRFANFTSRKLNLDYIKREFLWYLKGDRYDLSICDHASIWKGIVNTDGSINSNYGQYIFGDVRQFDNVYHTLVADKDSRRASIVILDSDHLLEDTKDVPCTYAINFRIRQDKLNMSVHMRSQDAVFGMGNDAPCFSFIHEMMYNLLKRNYPKLQYGKYFHIADSLHVYERHFEMLDKIANFKDKYTPVKCPKISGPEEVDFLLRTNFEYVPEVFQFTKWLNTFEKGIK